MEDERNDVSPGSAADSELVQKIAHGDPRAFVDLIGRCQEPLRRSISKLVGDSHMVDDIFQETCLRAYRSLKEGVRPDHVEAWLHGIARNCCREWYRQKKPFYPERLGAEGAISVEGLKELERQDAVKRAMVGLSEDARRVLLMRHHQDMTFDEIARAMNRPIGTVMSLAGRAYKKLREELSIFAESGPL